MINIVKELVEKIDKIENIDEKVEALNYIRSEISKVSPFKEPIDYVKWVKVDGVQANEYNPNKVATLNQL